MTLQVAALVPSVAVHAPSPLDAAQRQSLADLREYLLIGYFGLLALVLVSRTARDWREARRARDAA
ncbi:MAG TPA: hypothetical protein VNU71_20060 [Burkholderiaceae bacterium]|nr:hypothetical protein [Burkholderiaceae bacterium]